MFWPECSLERPGWRFVCLSRVRSVAPFCNPLSLRFCRRRTSNFCPALYQCPSTRRSLFPASQSNRGRVCSPRRAALYASVTSVFRPGGEHFEMKSSGKLKLTFYLLGLAGVALFTVLLIREGASKVMASFVTPEWVILGIASYHSIPIFLDAVAWWVLF